MSKSYMFEISALVLVNGQFWPVSVSFETPHNAFEDAMLDLQRKCTYLKKMGLLPGNAIPRGEPVVTENKPGTNVTSNYTPECPDHNSSMKLSKIQKITGGRAFYCSKKEDDVYCKRRASINIETGEIKFWEID